MLPEDSRRSAVARPDPARARPPLPAAMPQGGAVNIGAASAASGVSAKMIRHYEKIGLIPAAGRSAAGYRHYSGNDLATLRFIRRGRDLGFALEEIGQLLALWRDRNRPSGDVKALALRRVEELEAKAAALREMSQALRGLAEHCHGDDRPDCPILDELAEPGAACHPHAGHPHG